MMKKRDNSRAFVFTLVLATILAIVPLPGFLEMIWPFWMALVVIYWSLENPRYMSLGLVFAIGLLLDFLTVSLLGLHALRLVILAYLVLRFRARLRFFPPWQLGLSVLGLLVNDSIILLWINTLVGEPLPPLGYWLPAIFGALIWPLFFIALDRIRSVGRRGVT
ncbi:MAG TPA: rod shape-determining protein MreD [Xanthomonadales bacterium]|nr:rod shape-determining protein MreD [Xanthomonadales bacterium]